METSRDRRQFPRYPIKYNVVLSQPDGQNVDLFARNLSEGGVFVSGNPVLNPAVGELVSLKVNGLLYRQSGPVCLRVVRRTPEGLALAFP